MLVNAKIGEAMIHRVEPGQKVQVEVDAFPGEMFSGMVSEVAPRPDPGPYVAGRRKVYTTRIKLDKSLAGLRPGMTARS